MKGSVVLEKINDRLNQMRWEAKLVKLAKAFKDLNTAIATKANDPTGMQYFEAVTNFAEARDEERNVFWECFIEERQEDITVKTARIVVPKE